MTATKPCEGIPLGFDYDYPYHTVCLPSAPLPGHTFVFGYVGTGAGVEHILAKVATHQAPPAPLPSFWILAPTSAVRWTTARPSATTTSPNSHANGKSTRTSRTATPFCCMPNTPIRLWPT